MDRRFLLTSLAGVVTAELSARVRRRGLIGEAELSSQGD
jgi:hypothetical protein